MRLTVLLLINLFICTCGFTQVRDWENQYVFGINKEPYHVQVIPYNDEAQALNYDKSVSPFYKLISGTWKFNRVANESLIPEEFYKPEYNESGWSAAKVPGSVELQNFGTPIFKNVTYPFDPALPPFIPHITNPVNLYRHHFEIPSNWNGRQVYIAFNGIESAFYIYVNGKRVGYSENSYSTAEFNITPYIKTGDNLIAIENYRFSDGSYLEDQDYWRLSGIFRDVYVYAKPNVNIRDYMVVTDLDDQYKDAELKMKFQLQNNQKDNKEQYVIETTLFDAEKKQVLKGRSPLVKFMGAETIAEINQKLISPAKWNTEHPYLYTLVVSLKDKSGKTLEYLSSRIGVREVQIKNGVLLVNGVRIMIRGVNRHDHDARMGRYTSLQAMLTDAKLMKRFNINAVRTCHYPNDPAWYDICDEYGIYLCAEANLESHGVWDRLSKDSTWRNSFLDRIQSMVGNNKIHPSVIIWSLGNESGYGPNHSAMADWVHKYDITRPVHYNPADRDPHVDIVAPMYPSVESYTNLAKTDNRPVIMCEYAHAMGNSCGNLKEYWEPTYTLERAQGGYIWDWADQSFYTKNSQGKEFLANSGEMNDPQSEQFVGFDGVVLGDRTPQPELYDYKYIIQPVHITSIDALKGVFRIQNRYEATNLNTLQGIWELKEGGKVIQSGKLENLDVEPGKEKEIIIPFNKPALNPGYEYWINFNFITTKDAIWAAKGHQIATEQFRLQYSVPESPFKWDNKPKSLTLDDTQNSVIVKNEIFVLKLDKTSGEISSIVFNNKELIRQGPRLSLWRAPTDNDEKWWNMESPACKWRRLGLNYLRFAVKDVKTAYKPEGYIEVLIKQEVSSPYIKSIADYNTTYSIFPSGDIFINPSVHFKLNQEILPSWIAKLGVDIVMPGAFENFTWYGRGPVENYIDRNNAQHVGTYTSNVDSMYFPYTRPQSCGNMTDVRWAAITDGNGDGLAVYGLPVIETSALHYSQNSLDKYSLNEVIPSKDVFWTIDYQQTGLGGGSCGPDVRVPYRLLPGDMNYTIRLRPLNIKQTDPAALVSIAPFVANPKITPSSNTLSNKIEIVSETASCEIFYTTDGTEPTSSSLKYTAPLDIKKAVTIKARAFKTGMLSSNVVTQQYVYYANSLFTHEKVKYKEEPVSVDISVKGMNKLCLTVTDPDGDNSSDHADFAEARFVKADGSEIYLSDLTPTSAKQGWNNLQKNRSVERKEITIAGKKYTRGLGTHSVAEIWYKIPEGVVSFKSLFGVDDETNGNGSSMVGLEIKGVME